MQLAVVRYHVLSVLDERSVRK